MNIATNEDPDQADMVRLIDGHDTALNELMSRHSGRLFHYLIRLLQNETDAADLAQETFVRIYLHRSRFDVRKKFSTWLYAIATNLARDRMRRVTRRRDIPLESASEDESGAVDFLPAPDPHPGEKLESNERAAMVRQALADLPEDLRLPLVLSEYEEQSHADIGIVLGCSAKAVEMRIYRARQQLRAALGKLLHSEKKV